VGSIQKDNFRCKMDWEGDLVKNLFKCDDSFDIAPEVVLKWDQYKRTKETSSLNEGPSELNLALISKHHSLWAEFVYNAARVLADRIDLGLIITAGKRCLELGAGAGLPGRLDYLFVSCLHCY